MYINPMAYRESLVDVDEVLGDFQTPAMKVIEDVTGIRVDLHNLGHWDIFSVIPTPEEEAEVWKRISEPGFATKIEVLPGAQDFIKELRKMSHVVILTAPCYYSPTWVSERSQWLIDHFGFHLDDMHYTNSKFRVQGDLFLDDRPHHILNWQKRHPNGQGLLWNIPNTAGLEFSGIRVSQWGEVLGHADRVFSSL